MPRIVEWLLWRTLHLLFSLICCISALFSRFSGSIAALKTKNKELKEKTKEKPLTVAAVFEHQETIDKDGKIPQLLFWLSKENVNHVTLYDAQGALKRSQGQLQRTLNSLESKDQKIHCYSDKQAEMLSDLNGSNYLRDVQFITSRFTPVKRYDKLIRSSLRKRKDESPVVDDEPEYMAAVSHMKVELLSLQDGKFSLVRAARHVCENAYKIHYAEQSSKGSKLTEDDINKSLQEIGCEGPDPDLLLLFGTTRSLLGFPPWRLRLTEIVHMGSLKDLTASSFSSALKEFANKTHRYGR